MHIPSSGPLRKEEAEGAIRQAAEFFGKEFPDGRASVCDGVLAFGYGA